MWISRETLLIQIQESMMNSGIHDDSDGGSVWTQAFTITKAK